MSGKKPNAKATIAITMAAAIFAPRCMLDQNTTPMRATRMAITMSLGAMP